MTVAARFDLAPTQAATELRLLQAERAVPVAAWALSGHPGADVCQQWLVDGAATESGDVLLVEHAALARLSAAEAARIGLPPATQLRAVVEGDGVMVRPGFTLLLRWTRPGGQNAPGLERVGAWLREPAGWRRMPETLFAVAEAVAAHEMAQDEATRMSALASLRRALPAAALAGVAEANGLIGSVTIVEADALSLATVGEGDAIKIVPILHGMGDTGAGPQLSEDQQRLFGERQFHGWPTARPVYSLPGGTFVTVSPPLRQALDVVRRVASASPEERRAFLREPRPAIRAAIGDEAASALIDRLVIETPEWSERVIGLGLWQKRVLPWIALAGNDWFSDDPGTAPRGLTVGDQTLVLDAEAAQALHDEVADAIASGKPHVLAGDGALAIPATPETLEAIGALAPRPAGERPAFVIIRTNETERDIEAAFHARRGPELGRPGCLRTALKAHQHEGLLWLQRSWAAGSPGVLLADDMGLGKTLQSLAFLAWLRHGMAAGQIARRPLLIVAPTGLLHNWLAEHAAHLDPPRLGEPVIAYGAQLASLRLPDRSAGHLDQTKLQAADWVLTTFQTLRDHIVDFAQVHFAAVLMDEAQAVKTPAIRTTDAAKAVRADFRIAMTGTPVENRLSDLWCIVDGIAPGHLGELREFSRRYEGEAGQANLPELKRLIDRPLGGRPALMLRRLKEDKLPDLPERQDIVLQAPMGPFQRAAYAQAVALGRSQQGAGRVLEALQALRAASLHADLAAAEDDGALLAGSARLALALQVLDEVAGRGERALVFVESLQFMARLTGLLQRRYRMAAPPAIINGQVSGEARQARVDRFQNGPAGFDFMLISPRAGGVGLTLTRANHVLHLTRWWNPAVEDQASARAIRIGQTKPVSIYLLLATLPEGGASFDQNLHALLSRKRQLMRDALAPAQASQDELADMLRDTLA